MPNTQVQVLQSLKAKGRHPSKVTQVEYYTEYARLASLPRIVKDCASLASAKVREVRGDRIPLPLALENKAKCEANTCGSFGRIANDIPVCHQCHCSGKNLLTKWGDPKAVCPASLWDNTKITEREPKR